MTKIIRAKLGRKSRGRAINSFLHRSKEMLPSSNNYRRTTKEHFRSTPHPYKGPLKRGRAQRNFAERAKKTHATI